MFLCIQLVAATTQWCIKVFYILFCSMPISDAFINLIKIGVVLLNDAIIRYNFMSHRSRNKKIIKQYFSVRFKWPSFHKCRHTILCIICVINCDPSCLLPWTTRQPFKRLYLFYFIFLATTAASLWWQNYGNERIWGFRFISLLLLALIFLPLILGTSYFICFFSVPLFFITTTLLLILTTPHKHKFCCYSNCLCICMCVYVCLFVYLLSTFEMYYRSKCQCLSLFLMMEQYV